MGMAGQTVPFWKALRTRLKTTLATHNFLLRQCPMADGSPELV